MISKDIVKKFVVAVTNIISCGAPMYSVMSAGDIANAINMPIGRVSAVLRMANKYRLIECIGNKYVIQN